MKEVILTEENFNGEVLEYQGKVLVDFFATWCGPCKMLAPVLEKFAESRDDIKVCKLDVDKATPVAIRYGVNVIPTLILFENGKQLKKEVGLMDERQLENLVK